MPITVNHGPDQSRYASLMADAARRNENYTRTKDIANYFQDVKQGNREYELGKERNSLTKSGQDLQRELGLKDVELRQMGLDQQKLNDLNNYLIAQEDVRLKGESQAQQYELGMKASVQRGEEIANNLRLGLANQSNETARIAQSYYDTASRASTANNAATIAAKAARPAGLKETSGAPYRPNAGGSGMSTSWMYSH